MDNNENDPWHAAINAKLAEIAVASSPLPAWHEAWSRLGPESSEEQRLAVYRAVRDVGSVPDHATKPEAARTRLTAREDQRQVHQMPKLLPLAARWMSVIN
jgi:hypothetical protein